MSAYSFQDVSCSITGPGGTFNIFGVAEEGISISMVEDKNTMAVGADASVMHSLHAGNAGTVTIRLLKTSPMNALLMDMYRYQKASSANWGRNTISIRNAVRGDDAECREVAFKRIPDFANAKVGNIVEWSFDAGHVDEMLGDGNPVREF